MPLMRYELALLIPPFLLLARSVGSWEKRISFRESMTLLLLALTPLILLAFYHTVCFGAPWRAFNRYYAPDRNYWLEKPKDKQGGGFTPGEMLSNKVKKGLYQIFLQWPGPFGSWGFFVLQPVLWFCLPALPLFFKKCRTYAGFSLLSFLIIVGLSAANYSIDGGAMQDPRYATPILPLMYLALAWLFAWLARKSRTATYGIFFILSVFGLYMCAVHFAETDGDLVHPYRLAKEFRWTSLIAYEPFASLLQAVIPHVRQGLVLLILVAFISYLWSAHDLGSPGRARNFMRLCGRSMTSLYILLPLNLLLIGLTIYSYRVQENRFNSFSDTLKIGDRVVSVAVRRDGLVHSTGWWGTDLKGKVCKQGLLGAGRQVMRTTAPRGKTNFSFRAGFPDSKREEIQSKRRVNFVILVNNERAWRGVLSPQENRELVGTVPVPPGATVTLATYPVNGDHSPKVVWCDTKFQSVK
jgi:hypothetical protein